MKQLVIGPLIFGVFLLTALSSINSAYALSFGVGIGAADVKPEGTSNLENINPELNAKLKNTSWSFTLQAHFPLSEYFFAEVGLASLSYMEKEQKRNNIPVGESAANIRAYKITSKETYSALYGAVGLAVFLTDTLAVYGKAGPAISSTDYSVHQVVNYQNSEYQEQEDKSTEKDLDLYRGVGIFYNLSDSLSLKFDLEDFGVVGEGTEITGFYLPDTVDNPEATGSRIRRAMINILFRL